MDNPPTIFTDFLDLLRVPHTYSYSADRFSKLTFRSLFGLSVLLRDYKVASEGYRLADDSQYSLLPTPFIASTKKGMVIVTAVDGDTVNYISEGVPEKMPSPDFFSAADRNVFIAYPTQDSIEPDYHLHRRDIILSKLKDKVWIASIIVLFVWAGIIGGLFTSWSRMLICVLDLAGLWLTYMLVGKSLNIHSHAADRVCGVLQQGGCDDILKTSASKFFGMFGWSEVGFTYFSVSLFVLLVFPEYTNYLAAINVCCLPFTCWSIWYQKFRAKAWCTLCVGVQATLWLLFFSYLAGGWFVDIFPLKQQFFIIGISYLAVLLSLNKLMPKLENNDTNKAPDFS